MNLKPIFQKVTWRLTLVSLLLAVCLSFFSRQLNRKNQSVMVKRPSQQTSLSAYLPYKTYLKKNDQLSFTGSLKKSFYFGNSFTFIPDDCVLSLKINNRAVDLSPYSETSLCSFKYGFKIDLDTYLTKAQNSFEIEIQNTRNGPAGLNIYRGDQHNFLYSPLNLLAIFFICSQLCLCSLSLKDSLVCDCYPDLWSVA